MTSEAYLIYQKMRLKRSSCISEWRVEIGQAITSMRNLGIPGKRCKANNWAKYDVFAISQILKRNQPLRVEKSHLLELKRSEY